jgi:hypothetical protein
MSPPFNGKNRLSCATSHIAGYCAYYDTAPYYLNHIPRGAKIIKQTINKGQDEDTSYVATYPSLAAGEAGPADNYSSDRAQLIPYSCPAVAHGCIAQRNQTSQNTT